MKIPTFTSTEESLAFGKTATPKQRALLYKMRGNYQEALNLAVEAQFYRESLEGYMLKIWTNNSFEGYWPVGTAAVVITDTAAKAAKYLSASLKERGLPPVKSKDMQLMPLTEGVVRILCDGNY